MKEKLQDLRLKLGEEITQSEQKNILGGVQGYRCSTMPSGQCTPTVLDQGYCSAVWGGNLEFCNL